MACASVDFPAAGGPTTRIRTPDPVAPAHSGCAVSDTGHVESEPIFHLALAAEWEEAISAGVYQRSTIGRSLAEQGFIHCSYLHQLQAVADFH